MYTRSKDFESAKRNCPVGGTAFDCMPSKDGMRKGYKNKIGYVPFHVCAETAYAFLTGKGSEYNPDTNQILIFHK